ncbi:ASCH domain-containing protein [Acinetobacter rongchengensis]|uniref:ASCH domain-containing protein n=1 Tax=Acinetobacter rongchengensis TaxID=2419601 RepID=UPI002684DEE8
MKGAEIAPFYWIKNEKSDQALSIVAPVGQRISIGKKKLKIRLWQPKSLPLKDLLIIENKNDLIQDEDEEIGGAVVIVDIEAIHLFWTENELELAAASYREDGYWVWEISNVRPIENVLKFLQTEKFTSLM